MVDIGLHLGPLSGHTRTNVYTVLQAISETSEKYSFPSLNSVLNHIKTQSDYLYKGTQSDSVGNFGKTMPLMSFPK